MPARDGTGPLGRGPLTGRGLGPCGRGLGFRRGSGRGFGRGFAPYATAPVQPVTKEQELADLKTEKELIEGDLKAIEVRLKELESKK